MKNMGQFMTKIIILVIIGLFAGFFANAQLFPGPVSLSASPESPSPGETFTVKASVLAFDKNTALFEWTVNDKKLADDSGLGKDNIILTAGELGSNMRITTRITRLNGAAISISITVPVSDLSLTWFAETYVPKWYKGKALPIQNSVVNIIAVPTLIVNGRLQKAENLIYNWKLDGKENELSGVGKQVFRIRTSDMPLTSHQIEVSVEDLNKKIYKTGQLLIINNNPFVLIYPSSPLGGIEPRTSITNFATTKRGIFDFAAEPFFFPVTAKKILSWKWAVAGNEIKESAENPHLLTVDTTGQPVGNIPIGIVAEDNTQEFLAPQTKIINLLLQ